MVVGAFALPYFRAEDGVIPTMQKVCPYLRAEDGSIPPMQKSCPDYARRRAFGVLLHKRGLGRKCDLFTKPA